MNPQMVVRPAGRSMLIRYLAVADFTFRQIDRGTARYTEGDRVLTIDAEASFGPLGPSGLIVYLSAAKSWDHPPEPITEADRRRIEANLRSLGAGMDLC